MIQNWSIFEATARIIRQPPMTVDIRFLRHWSLVVAGISLTEGLKDFPLESPATS